MVSSLRRATRTENIGNVVASKATEKVSLVMPVEGAAFSLGRLLYLVEFRSYKVMRQQEKRYHTRAIIG